MGLDNTPIMAYEFTCHAYATSWDQSVSALLCHFSTCYYGLSLTAYAPNVTLLLSLSRHQGQKGATCLFITCPRSSEMRNSCKCSCLLATSSLPKSLWTERPIRANVLVSQKSTVKRKKKSEQSNAQVLPGSITQAGRSNIKGRLWREKVDALIA